MTTLDIVELIEKNPITTLSKNYQSKLINKIKTNFNNNEQQLFIASFYSYLNNNPHIDFVIDLDNIWKWLGFGQKDTAKRVMEKYFLPEKDYKCLLRSSPEQKKGRGGHNKETILLTISTFKRFCLKADTKKADQIHEYYIKLEETLHEVINEESNELKLQLEQVKTEFAQKEITNKITFDKTLQKEKELEKQKVLLREFAHAGSLVYVVRVKSYENGEYIIKIGESRRGVEARFNEHKSKYEEAILLDCFLVKRSKDFETFIHNHKDIKLNQVTDLLGHEKENELFLIGKKLSYNILLNIIKTNVNLFNEIDYDEIKEEIMSLKNVFIEKQSDNVVIKMLLDNQNLLMQKINGLEKSNKEILEKLNASQTRTTTGFEIPLPTIGPRLQKINPDTSQIIRIYETVSECMKEDPKMKRPSINQAVEKNILYHGFRWALVDRELDPNVVHNLQPTVKTKAQNLGYIAKLNQDKTQILNVYLDRKTAAISNGYESHSALDNPVKNISLTKGNYYLLYDTCNDNLKEDFINRNNGEPILYKEGIGQFDAQNNMTREFLCKYDCIKSLKLSDKTLTKALDKNIAYNGFYYKSIGSKTQCL